MATTTPNIGLTLPIGTENVSRQIINGNNTLIDTAVGSLSDQIAKLNYSAVLTSSNNLNSISDGAYWYESTNRPSNTPATNNSIVEQITIANGNQKFQTVTTADNGVINIYKRRYFQTWGSWYKFTGTVVS